MADMHDPMDDEDDGEGQQEQQPHAAADESKLSASIQTYQIEVGKTVIKSSNINAHGAIMCLRCVLCKA